MPRDASPLPPRTASTTRAGDGARTRDIKLGRLALYQLSYSRDDCPVQLHATHRSTAHGGGRIRTFEGVNAGRFTVCSRWPLGHPTGSLLAHRPLRDALIDAPDRADGENRTRNRLITNQVLCQLSYVSRRPFLRETRRIVGPGSSVKPRCDRVSAADADCQRRPPPHASFQLRLRRRRPRSRSRAPSARRGSGPPRRNRAARAPPAAPPDPLLDPRRELGIVHRRARARCRARR